LSAQFKTNKIIPTSGSNFLKARHAPQARLAFSYWWFYLLLQVHPIAATAQLEAIAGYLGGIFRS